MKNQYRLHDSTKRVFSDSIFTVIKAFKTIRKAIKQNNITADEYNMILKEIEEILTSLKDLSTCLPHKIIRSPKHNYISKLILNITNFFN